MGSNGHDADEIMAQALQIREETGDNDAFDNFLEAHGFTVARETHEHTIEKTVMDGDASAEKLTQNEFFASPSLISPCNESGIYADFSFSHSGTDDSNVYGDDPKDIIGIAYSDFNRYNDSSQTGDYVCSPEHDWTCGDLSTQGIGFQYDDNSHDSAASSTAIGSWCAVKLEPDDIGDPSTANVIFEYYHNYQTGTV